MKQGIALKVKRCPTHVVKICIAGDINLARTYLQKWAMRGACVMVTECEYIYTMGIEKGMEITLINYPRFPKTVKALQDQALLLAMRLIDELYQGSCTIIDSEGESIFLTRRSEDID